MELPGKKIRGRPQNIHGCSEVKQDAGWGVGVLSEDGRNRVRCRQMMYCGPVKANNQKCSVVDIAIQAWVLVSSLNILNDHIWKTLTTFLNYVCIKHN